MPFGPAFDCPRRISSYLARSRPLLAQRHPEPWTRALAALQDYPKVLGVLFYESNTAAGEHLRRRAPAAGLKKPEKKIQIW